VVSILNSNFITTSPHQEQMNLKWMKNSLKKDF
jgi:hypothetical protein